MTNTEYRHVQPDNPNCPVRGGGPHSFRPRATEREPIEGGKRQIESVVQYYCTYCLSVVAMELPESAEEQARKPLNTDLAGVQQMVDSVRSFLEASDEIAAMPRDVELRAVTQAKERQATAKLRMASLIGYPSK